MKIQEAIEYFHLSFCNRLAAKVDRKLFCLKGGCNLRFYFNSIRYSEDIDFDAHKISTDTLKKNVEQILKDGTFKMLLKLKDIELADWSAPKQTETTQRWKVSFRIGAQTGTIPTKIEFSRRKPEFTGAAVNPVDPQLIQKYQLQSLTLQHYELPAAIEQKIGALIGRTETQARDVIDLKILKDKLSGAAPLKMPRAERDRALETLMSVSFDHFKSQVWPYLMEEHQDYYGEKKVWDQLQAEIAAFLERIPEVT